MPGVSEIEAVTAVGGAVPKVSVERSLKPVVLNALLPPVAPPVDGPGAHPGIDSVAGAGGIVPVGTKKFLPADWSCSTLLLVGDSPVLFALERRRSLLLASDE